MTVRRFRAFGLIRATALVARAAPGLAAALLAFVLGNAIASVLQIIAAGLVVGAMPGAIRAGLASGAGRHMLVMLLVFSALSVSLAVIGAVQAALASALRFRVASMVDDRLIAASLDPPGIAHLEDPGYADELRHATADEWKPELLAQWLPAVIAPRLQAIGLIIILARFSWWAPIVLALAAIFTYQQYLHVADNVYQSMADSTPVIRRAGYYHDLLIAPDPAKEIRLFGLRDWLLDQMSATWQRGMSTVWQRRRSAQRGVYATVLLVVLAEALVLTSMVSTAVHGGLSLATFVIAVQAAVALPLLGWAGDADYLVRNAISALGALEGLVKHGARLSAPAAGRRGEDGASGCAGGQEAEPGPLRHEIAFESVGFGYPRTKEPVLRQLSLRIPAGQSVAIVGINGAGKTTLIKLLARLYDPDSGRILVDGTDLRDLDPAQWRARTAIIFQDFARYPLSLRENVGFGDSSRIADQAALEQALATAGGASLPGTLPAGWDTVLSRQFDDGADLSGGEWQKVALARALLAGQRAAVLILDEPSAHLDARAEAALYERFLDLTRGLTSVLISHRFAGVRKADLIYVLDAGQVIEAGTHAELIAADGRYAQMYRVQAARFAGDNEATAGTRSPAPVAAPYAAPVSGTWAGAGTSADAAEPDPEFSVPVRRSLASSIGALSTLWRGCLGERRGLVARSFVVVPAAAALGALQALWLRKMIDGAEDHAFDAAMTGTALLVATIGLWRAAELMATTDRITLSERIGFAFDQMVAALTAALPGLRQHETPAFQDRLHLLQSRMLSMGSLLNWVLNALQDLGGFVITAALLGTIYPPLLLLIPVGLLALWLQSVSQRIASRAQEASAPGYRLARQLRELATSASAGKEIRVFRLGDQIAARQRAAHEQADRIMIRAQYRTGTVQCASALLSTLSMIIAMTVVAVLAARGQVTLSAVLLVFLLAMRFLGHVSGLVQATQVVAGQLQTAERFRWLSGYASKLRPAAPTASVPHKLRKGITLDHVSFRYPGTSAQVLRDVSVHFPAGAVVALVGDNGAGKTTLVKLLCRMYEPTAGNVYIEDARLDELDPDLWRQSLSAGFQDFVRFELIARETVGLGDLPKVEDSTAVADALARATASDLAPLLPDGLGTQLGRRWPGGVDLSAGQWQKLALGRALMRTEPLLLLLDEPTASLDPETEYALFERFAAATRCRNSPATTTILVSHRFSTVRMADQIVVLDQGTVAETGSHAELMAADGLYAHMYSLQAHAYQ